MTTNYQKGYQKEIEVVNYFRKQGYQAYRSAGSHTPCDVTVHFPDSILVLQLKTTKTKYVKYEKEIQELRDFKTPARKEFWIWQKFEKRGKKWKKIVIY